MQTNTLLYVVSAPYFWQSIGMTTAIGMWVGAILFNGDLKTVTKVVFSMMSYGTMLMFLNSARILSVTEIHTEVSGYAFSPAVANIYALGFVTIAYVCGMLVGVWLVNHARNEQHAKH